MNMKNQKYWDQLRTAYRPEAPALDVASIMDAVRREAAAQPLRRIQPGGFEQQAHPLRAFG